MTLKAMRIAKAVAPPKRHLSTQAKKLMPAKKAMKMLKAMKSMKAAKADTPATRKRRRSSGDGKANRSEQVSEQISEQISRQISEEVSAQVSAQVSKVVSEQVSEQIAKAMKGRTPDSGGAAQPAAPGRVSQPNLPRQNANEPRLVECDAQSLIGPLMP